MQATLLGFGCLALGLLAFPATSAQAQQGSVSSGLGGSVSSGLESSVPGGIGSGLGLPGGRGGRPESLLRRDQERDQELGTCAPGQADPDNRGCRPVEWIVQDRIAPHRLTLPDPNRITNYYGDLSYNPNGF